VLSRARPGREPDADPGASGPIRLVWRNADPGTDSLDTNVARLGPARGRIGRFRRSPEAAANVLDTGLSRDLETMIERTESELERQLALTRDLMERIESPAPDHPRFRPITRPGDSVCDRRRARLQRHDRGHQR
jgi:hypothetical protein